MPAGPRGVDNQSQERGYVITQTRRYLYRCLYCIIYSHMLVQLVQTQTDSANGANRSNGYQDETASSIEKRRKREKCFFVCCAAVPVFLDRSICICCLKGIWVFSEDPDSGYSAQFLNTLKVIPTHRWTKAHFIMVHTYAHDTNKHTTFPSSFKCSRTRGIHPHWFSFPLTSSSPLTTSHQWLLLWRASSVPLKLRFWNNNNNNSHNTLPEI